MEAIIALIAIVTWTLGAVAARKRGVVARPYNGVRGAANRRRNER
jgi:hypothetical protein